MQAVGRGSGKIFLHGICFAGKKKACGRMVTVSQPVGVFDGIPGVFLSGKRRARRVLDDFGKQDAGRAGIWICKLDAIWKGEEPVCFFDEAFIRRILFSGGCGGSSVTGRILMHSYALSCK